MSSEGMPTVRLDGSFPRWEYHVALIDTAGLFAPHVDVNEIGQYLNGMGTEGWELVSMVNISRGQGQTAGLLAILKRLDQG